MTTGLNITLRTHAVNSNLVPDRRKNAKTRARNMTIHSDLLYFSRDIELHLFIMIIKHSKKCRRVCLIFAILSVKVWVLLFNIGPMLKIKGPALNQSAILCLASGISYLRGGRLRRDKWVRKSD